MLLYHRVLQYSDWWSSQSLAKTALGVMIPCMFGGPTFISKMLSVAKLNLSFEFA